MRWLHLTVVKRPTWFAGSTSRKTVRAPCKKISLKLPADRKKLTGKTSGKLDTVFVEATSKKTGSVHYEVTYQFTANGAHFKGEDNVSSKPLVSECTVFFDPADPTDNALSESRARASLFAAGIILGIVIYVLAPGKAK